MEIARQIEYSCPTEGTLNNVLNRFRLNSTLNKIYPNENEPPKIEGTASGTGVIISGDGYILTNFHVVKELKYNWIWKSSEVNKDSIKELKYNWVQLDLTDISDGVNLCSDSIYTTVKGKYFNLRVVEANVLEDWAILKIDDSTFSTKDYIVFDTANMDIGTEVYTLGFPMSVYYGNDIKYTNGYISSNANRTFYSVNMGINPGNSGAGLFNKSNGQLIGLTTSRFDENAIGINVEGVSFSIRPNNITRLLKANDYFFLNHIHNDESRCWSCIYYRVSNRRSKRIQKPRILIRDNVYNPQINTNRNLNATIQIISD
jgi:hypothetical protein